MATRPASAGLIRSASSSTLGSGSSSPLVAGALAALNKKPIVPKGKGKGNTGDPKIGETLLGKMGDEKRTALCMACWQKKICHLHSGDTLSGYTGLGRDVRLISTRALPHLRAVEGGDVVCEVLVDRLHQYKNARSKSREPGKGKSKGKGNAQASFDA